MRAPLEKRKTFASPLVIWFNRPSAGRFWLPPCAGPVPLDKSDLTKVPSLFVFGWIDLPTLLFAPTNGRIQWSHQRKQHATKIAFAGGAGR
jgi:hypothetical protein